VTFEIEYDDSAERTVVGSTEELDAVLDRLDKEARAENWGYGIYVYEVAEGDVLRALAIGIGRDFSFLRWIDMAGNRGSHSVGGGEKESEWLHPGEPSTVDAGSLISINVAREVAH